MVAQNLRVEAGVTVKPQWRVGRSLLDGRQGLEEP
jgi:hypothetical protein